MLYKIAPFERWSVLDPLLQESATASASNLGTQKQKKPSSRSKGRGDRGDKGKDSVQSSHTQQSLQAHSIIEAGFEYETLQVELC